MDGSLPDLSKLFFGPTKGPWQERLAYIVSVMRDLSSQTDPQGMVRIYGEHMRRIVPTDGFVALSRRGLERPFVRVTRSSRWDGEVNPWREKDRLPVLGGGLLSDLIWGDEPVVIDDLTVDPADPGHEYLAGMRSLIASPNYDRGVAMNMSVQMRREPAAFHREMLPEQVWMSNLFGRATHNLVLGAEVRTAYDLVDRELKLVAEVQRGLLPQELPRISGMSVATHYQTSTRAGGDYYDFLPLAGRDGEPPCSPRGRWGILLADVSGHGTAAAVLMAVTHSIVHGYPVPPVAPGEFLRFVNVRLCERYTTDTGRFVTAFYGVYDPVDRTLTYSSAGHPAPRVRHSDGRVAPLDASSALPLGVDRGEAFGDESHALTAGDSVLLYTDGITEAKGARNDLLGTPRLDRAIATCDGDADALIRCVLADVRDFTGDQPIADDQTLVAMKVIE